jgi:hypothetical protein
LWCLISVLIWVGLRLEVGVVSSTFVDLPAGSFIEVFQADGDV